MLNRTAFVVLMLFTGSQWGLPLLAEDGPPKYPVDTETFTVTLTSEEGPVAGASLRLYACRCEEDPGSHYGWPQDNTDVPTEYTSDEGGVVELQYPVKFGSPDNWKTLNQISMMVTHAEFVPDEIHIDPRLKKTTKQLEAGCELSFSAIDAGRNPVEIGVMMAGPGRAAKWIREQGIVRSRAIPDGVWQTLVVAPRPDGRHLFSDVLPVRLRDQQRVRFHNLPLTPGLRLTGRLSDNVPRPVVDGRIQAFCLPQPAGRLHDREDPSVAWEANTLIDADGSFEFASLPRSGTIQLIAICQGWVGADQDVPEEHGTFKQGMFVALDEQQIQDGSFDVVVPMEPTGSLLVTVLKPDGSPLAGAKVATNPNEYRWLAGSTILGSKRDWIDSVRAQMNGTEDPLYRRGERDEPVPVFQAITDERGQVVLSGIPCDREYQVGAYHDDYTMPEGDRGRRQQERYVCKRDEQATATIQLQPLSERP